MDSQHKLNERLLKLFPVKLLKDFFAPKQKTDFIKEIISKNAADSIRNFASDNFNHTKQHIYIFDLDKIYHYKFSPFKSFPFEIKEILKNDKTGEHSFIFFPIVDLKLVVLDPPEDITLNFYQPFFVTLKQKCLIIQATILEKNFSSYYPNRRVVDVKKVNGEEEYVIPKILSFFAHRYSIEICDLNKGIKQLWAKDIIDSQYIKYKRNRSVSTETMDENYTLKQQYPDLYEAITSTPINKTIFKYLGKDQLLPDHFTADPSKGELSVSLFPIHIKQVPNVIDKVLSGN